eukprot:m.155122 g.155122  ORF g.155122 m.155122 type:complete len:713 (-) comp16268_c0_seq5:424-2562(-)
MERSVRWHSRLPLSPAASRTADALDSHPLAHVHAHTHAQAHARAPGEAEEPPAVSSRPHAHAHVLFTWLEQIEQQRENEQEGVIAEYLQLLKNYKERSQAMKEEIMAALDNLDGLRDLYTSVSSQTSAIHLACEQLLQDERELVQSCDAVSSRLQYFKDYDRLRKLINSPTLSVMSDQFISILSRLDECIIFLSEHAEYADAQTYVTRFRHLRNKGLALAHTRITNTIRSLMQPEKGGTAERAIRADDKSVAQIRALMEQLERRRSNGEEYGNLLQACYNFYFEQRHDIRTASIFSMIESNIATHQADLPRLIRNGCSFMKTLCEEERVMYNRFFTVVNQGFNNMIDGMTRRFYDAVRPLFLQRTVSLDDLVQLCSVITVEVLEDQDMMSAFAAVAEEMLADVQERLVYRAQTFIDTAIRRHTPTKDEINYPTRLHLPEDGSADVTTTWYPPVKSALTLLSQLYRSLERSVCEGIAQEILEAALVSLDTASRALKGLQGSFHAELFLIKHLLVIREQIAPFDFSFVLTEVGLDFSSIRDAAVDLLSQTNNLFRFDRSNALYSFLLKGAPTVTKDRLDARKEIDTQLRDVCRSFIEHQVQLMVQPIKALLQQVEKLKEPQKREFPRLSFATPEKLHDIHATAFDRITTELQKLRENLNLYLRSGDTEGILFKPMKVCAVKCSVELKRQTDFRHGVSKQEQVLPRAHTVKQMCL